MISGKDEFWRYLFSPETIAVIGASSVPWTWGWGVTRRLFKSENKRVYPVNPNVPEVLGKRTYPSVIDIPDAVDLAVIVVPAPQVAKVLRECVQKRVKAAHIISSGFAETGEEGHVLEAELLEIAREGNLHFIGPNSLGYANTAVNLCTVGWIEKIIPGSVGLVSQSGNYAHRLVEKGTLSNIGFSKFVSVGNEADLHFEDFLAYLAQDENTRIIAAYIEGLREGRRFYQLAKEITARKPMVVVKSGSTGASAQAARSHTGALAGSEMVYTSAFRQAGVIRVENDDELCDLITALLYQPLPRSNRTAILTVGGGMGVVGAEACEREGLEITPLAPATMEKLNALLPPRWSHGNPIDMVGVVHDIELVFSCLKALMEDENIAAIILQAPVAANGIHEADIPSDKIRAFQEKRLENVRVLKEWVKQYGKPVFAVTSLPDPKMISFLSEQGVPAYPSPNRAARVLHYLTWYQNYLRATGAD